MMSYGEAKARAKALTPYWNEREYIAKAVITWADSDYEYDLEVENSSNMNDDEFTEWIEENAEELAEEAAAKKGTNLEEICGIDYETDYFDDDALFEEEYENACEFEWECMSGR